MRHAVIGVAFAAAAVAAAVGLRDPGPGHDHAGDHHGGGRFLGVTWAARPQSLAALEARATAVVTAEVVAVHAGPALQPPSGTPDAAAAAIPTQRIAFRALALHRGAVPARFTLFKTGDPVTWLAGDPPYAVGERYLLYLQARLGPDGRPDGTWLPAAPDGRLRLTAWSGVEPLIAGAVADEVRGRTPADLVGGLR